MAYKSDFPHNPHAREANQRLDFVRVNHREKEVLIYRLKEMARLLKDENRNKWYRIVRIYLPIINQGKMPSTREFPQLMRQAGLDVHTLVKELRTLVNFILKS